MPKEIFLDIWERIAEGVVMIEERFSDIHQPSDFKSSKLGETNFDAIMMRFQIIGELLKQVDKADKTFLSNYQEVNWKDIMKMREIISHHYDLLDYEVVFYTCKNDLPVLKSTIDKMVLSLKQGK